MCLPCADHFPQSERPGLAGWSLWPRWRQPMSPHDPLLTVVSGGFRGANQAHDSVLATSSLDVECFDCPGVTARPFQNLGEPGISSSTPKPQCRHRSVRSRRSPNLRRCCATMPRGFLHRGHGTRPITTVKIRMLARNTPIPTNSRTLPFGATNPHIHAGVAKARATMNALVLRRSK